MAVRGWRATLKLAPAELEELLLTFSGLLWTGRAGPEAEGAAAVWTGFVLPSVRRRTRLLHLELTGRKGRGQTGRLHVAARKKPTDLSARLTASPHWSGYSTSSCSGFRLDSLM